jgi:molybdenum cofactor cytidylyltransferase
VSPSKTLVIILAAGEGKRMGMPKALLEYEKGKSFLAQLASTYRKADVDPRAVVGFQAAEVSAHHPDIEVVENPRWSEGQFSSIRAGLRSVLAEGAEAIFIHPVDMPALRSSTVKSLLERLEGHDAVVPEFEGLPGHPLLLSAAAAQKVMAMDDVPHMEVALKQLDVLRVPTKDPGVAVNVNTPEVYERVLGSPPHLAPPKKNRRNKRAATVHT